MAHGKTVLVLGGGIGGIVAATRLRQMLPREHRVVLVERESRHVFAPSFLWLMIGQRSAEQISRPVARLAKRGIELIQGTIERIDPAARTIRIDGKELSGDYVVIALGADLAPETIPGLAQAGHNFYTLEGAASLRDAGLCADSGWVPVDRGTLETKFPGVYAIGDVTGIMLTSINKPLPKAGVFAHNEAEVVAHNIARAITGKGAERRFTGDGECFLESGDGRAAFGSGNFYADPAPQIRLRQPSMILHLGKVAYEKFWLFRWF